MREVIEWEENEKGTVVGTILDVGPTQTQLLEEIKNMPIDVKSYKNKEKTEKVYLKYPEHFSELRAEDLEDSIKKYLLSIGDWKIEQATSFKGLVLIPQEIESEQKI